MSEGSANSPDPDNTRHIEIAITTLRDQIEMKIRNRPWPDPFVAQQMTTPGILGDLIIPKIHRENLNLWYHNI